MDSRIVAAVIGAVAVIIAAIIAAHAAASSGQPNALPPSSLGTIAPVQSATPLAGGTVLGGIDLNTYCQSGGYASVESVQPDAYGWRCVDSNGSTSSIDIIAACRAQYNDPAAEADYRNFDDPDSWYCVT
jgi:hypothetical protein